MGACTIGLDPLGQPAFHSVSPRRPCSACGPSSSAGGGNSADGSNAVTLSCCCGAARRRRRGGSGAAAAAHFVFPADSSDKPCRHGVPCTCRAVLCRAVRPVPYSAGAVPCRAVSCRLCRAVPAVPCQRQCCAVWCAAVRCGVVRCSASTAQCRAVSSRAAMSCCAVQCCVMPPSRAAVLSVRGRVAVPSRQPVSVPGHAMPSRVVPCRAGCAVPVPVMCGAMPAVPCRAGCAVPVPVRCGVSRAHPRSRARAWPCRPRNRSVWARALRRVRGHGERPSRVAVPSEAVSNSLAYPSASHAQGALPAVPCPCPCQCGALHLGPILGLGRRRRGHVPQHRDSERR